MSPRHYLEPEIMKTSTTTQAIRDALYGAEGWNLDSAWQSGDDEADGIAHLGHIDEDGSKDSVAEFDTGNYFAEYTALPLARFYAACNHAAITALLAELDAARDGIEAAVLAERERCYAAVLDTSPRMTGEAARLLRFDICSAINRGIREGVKS